MAFVTDFVPRELSSTFETKGLLFRFSFLPRLFLCFELFFCPTFGSGSVSLKRQYYSLWTFQPKQCTTVWNIRIQFLQFFLLLVLGLVIWAFLPDMFDFWFWLPTPWVPTWLWVSSSLCLFSFSSTKNPHQFFSHYMCPNKKLLCEKSLGSWEIFGIPLHYAAIPM